MTAPSNHLINQHKNLETQLRFAFMVLQHRIEERNYTEAIQNSSIVSKILMDLQRVSLELSQSTQEDQNAGPTEDQTG